MSAKFPRGGGGGSKPILSHPSINGKQIFSFGVLEKRVCFTVYVPINVAILTVVPVLQYEEWRADIL